MSSHWHTSIDNILIYGLSAILVINVLRLFSAWLVTLNGPFGIAGKGIGAVVS